MLPETTDPTSQLSERTDMSISTFMGDRSLTKYPPQSLKQITGLHATPSMRCFSLWCCVTGELWNSPRPPAKGCWSIFLIFLSHLSLFSLQTPFDGLSLFPLRGGSGDKSRVFTATKLGTGSRTCLSRKPVLAREPLASPCRMVWEHIFTWLQDVHSRFRLGCDLRFSAFGKKAWQDAWERACMDSKKNGRPYTQKPAWKNWS